MKRKHRRSWVKRHQAQLIWVILPLSAVPLCALLIGYLLAPAPNNTGVSGLNLETQKLVENADVALKAGNTRLALAQLRDAVRLSPTNGEVRGRLGIALLNGGQEVAAERELRQAINGSETNNPPYELVIPNLLRTMLARNELKELLAEFPEPPPDTQDKTAADVLRARSTAFQQLGQPKEARAAMDRSLVLRRDAEGLLRSAILAQQQGDNQLARSQTDETIKLSPKFESALRFSVLLSQQSGDKQKTLASVDEYVEHFPTSVNAKAAQIGALLDLNMDSKAGQAVVALLKESPKSPFGQFYRGVLMARAKNFNGAWAQVQLLPQEFVQSQAATVASIAVASGHANIAGAILTAYVANNPADRLARLQLAATWLGQNATQAAIDALTPAKASNDPPIHAVLAQGYLGLERYDDAIASLEIATPSAAATALRKQRAAEFQADSSDRAIQRFRGLVERLPGNEAASIALITELMAVSKWDEASVAAEDMARQSPQSPFSAFYQGQILRARGDLVHAEAAFGKALALNPKFVPGLYYRADVRVARGNAQDAKADLQRILAQDPQGLVAKNRLAELTASSSRARSN